MNITKIFSGYCPVQDCDQTIAITYGQIRGGKYIPVSADCPYASQDRSKCNIIDYCPIRSQAPSELSSAE